MERTLKKMKSVLFTVNPPLQHKHHLLKRTHPLYAVPLPAALNSSSYYLLWLRSLSVPCQVTITAQMPGHCPLQTQRLPSTAWPQAGKRGKVWWVRSGHFSANTTHSVSHQMCMHLCMYFYLMWVCAPTYLCETNPQRPEESSRFYEWSYSWL